MTVFVKQSLRHFVTQEQIELRTVMTAVQTDLAAVLAGMAIITAQLDADGGVTDTDYAANSTDLITLQLQP